LSIDRIADRFERSETQAVNTARVQLDMILANEDCVLKVRNGAEKVKAARDFDALLKHGEALTPGQLSYIDGIYEATWKGAGFDSVNAHHDKPTGTLRHPK
jgi:hypothetical protein